MACTPLVSLFIPSVRGGGAERAMLVFGAELLKRGYAVDLVVIGFEGHLRALVPEGIRVVNLAQRRAFRALPALISYLRTRRPKALFSTIMHANVIAALATKISGMGIPLVVRESNVPISEPKRTLSRWLTFKLLPHTYRFASGVIAVSQGVAAELLSIDESLQPLIHVIPTPVISADVLANGEAGLAHPWFRAGEPPVVLGVGRLMPHKGFLTLMRAFAQVRKTRPLRLVILGDGPERERLTSEAKALGIADDVELAGFTTNPFKYMQRARVFVLASEYEGLPNVLIQAMAFGTPVVATDCKSGPAEILDNGKRGILVPVGDAGRLAEGIERSLSFERQTDTALHVISAYGAVQATTAYLGMAGLEPCAPGYAAVTLPCVAVEDSA